MILNYLCWAWIFCSNASICRLRLGWPFLVFLFNNWYVAIFFSLYFFRASSRWALSFKNSYTDMHNKTCISHLPKNVKRNENVFTWDKSSLMTSHRRFIREWKTVQQFQNTIKFSTFYFLTSLFRARSSFILSYSCFVFWYDDIFCFCFRWMNGVLWELTT